MVHVDNFIHNGGQGRNTFCKLQGFYCGSIDKHLSNVYDQQEYHIIEKRSERYVAEFCGWSETFLQYNLTDTARPK